MTVRLLDEAKAGTQDGVGVALRGVEESGIEVRSVVVVSADVRLRERLASSLSGLRWRVLEAAGGAEAMMRLEARGCEAMLIDNWLPDLEVHEFTAYVRMLYPGMDLLCLDGGLSEGRREGLDRSARSPRRNELLHAIEQAREPVATRASDGAAESVDGALKRRAEAYRLTPDGSMIDGSLQMRMATLDVAIP